MVGPWLRRQREQRATAASSRGTDGISLHLRDEGAAAAVSVAGRLEEGGDAELIRVVRSLRRAGTRLLVLDLNDLDAIDAHGMMAVLEIEAESRERPGWELAVVPPLPRVAPELVSAELREILCLVAREDAGYVLDAYATSMRSTSSRFDAQRER